MNKNLTDVIGRLFFGILFLFTGFDFLASGGSHLDLLPWWFPIPNITVAIYGIIFIFGGMLFLAGIWLQIASVILGFMLVFNIAGIHIPGFIEVPVSIRVESEWLWMLLLKNNLIKDLSLLGACISYFNHQLGSYSLEEYLRRNGFEPTPWRKAPPASDTNQSEASSSQ